MPGNLGNSDIEFQNNDFADEYSRVADFILIAKLFLGYLDTKTFKYEKINRNKLTYGLLGHLPLVSFL